MSPDQTRGLRERGAWAAPCSTSAGQLPDRRRRAGRAAAVPRHRGGCHVLRRRAGQPRADGRAVDELAGLPGKAWVRFIVQDGHGQLVPLKPGEPPGGGDLGDTAAWLTTRQAEVLRLAAAALVAKEIARRLGISDDDGKDRAGGEGSRGAEPMTFPHIRGQEAVSTWN